MAKYYQEVMVWKRLSASLSIRYSCLKNLANGKYMVQSADYFHLPVDAKTVEQHTKQFAELFTETDPMERARRSSSSLRKAIYAFEEYFGGMSEE